jgi:hypothetical protein
MHSSQDGSRYFFDPIIEGNQDVEIYDPISVSPKVLVLPWTPINRNNYPYQLKVGNIVCFFSKADFFFCPL